MNNILFVMTVCGSVPVCLYLLLHGLLRERVNPLACRYLLGLSILFYLVPFSKWSYILRGFMMKLTQDEALWTPKGHEIEVPLNVYSENGTVVYWGNKSSFYYFLIILWITGIAFFIIRDIRSYYRLRKEIAASHCFSRHDFVSTGFLRRKITIHYSDKTTPPFSTGLLHPIIVIPDSLSPQTEELILLHEKHHIRNLHFLSCFVASLVRAVHWFNPLSHLLLQEVKYMTELDTDHNIMASLNENLRRKYGCLILNIMQKEPQPTRISSLKMSFSDHSFQLCRERIRRIKNMTANKKTKAVPVLITMIAACLLNILPILAYDNPIVITSEFTDESDPFSGDSYYIPDDADPYYYQNIPGMSDLNEFSLDYSASASYFIGDDGTILPVLPTVVSLSSESIQRSCSHTWVTGKQSVHKKNADGSCDLTVYNVRRYSKCGAIVKEGIYSSMHFPVCPH